MMTQLTTADRFEIVDAQYYNKVRSEYRDKTADVEIDRWNNYGKDRLYINNLKTGDGWISLKDDDFGGSRWTSSKADWGLDGDELTIKIGSGPTWTYVITVKVHGDDFEAVTTEPRDIDFDDLEECVSETTEIRTDGGEIDDRTQHITDDDIEHGTDGGAIQDINKVREALETFQRSAEETWSEHMDGIEQGYYWIVEETDDVIVLAADDVLYNEYLSPTGHDTTDYHHAVSGVMHSIAKRLTDYNWGYSYPVVIAKPDDFDSGRRFAEAVVNG